MSVKSQPMPPPHKRPSDLDTRQVAILADAMDPEQIAEILGVAPKAIIAILNASGSRQRWVLICLKSQRMWPCWSERACYLCAQILGLTEYTFGRAPA